MEKHMNVYKEQIIEVESYINQNDLNLGYRRMIDLVLDMGDIKFFQKIIEYSNIYYKDSMPEDIKKIKALELLNEIDSAPIPKFKEDEVLISTQDVEKAYSNRNFKLHPITFDLKTREVVGLVGENGNGKTTLLRLIGGELKESAGKINYHFSTAKSYSYDLKSQLVFVPQRIEKLYGNLMDNLQFTLSSYNIKGEENFLLAQVMLARLGLWQYRKLEWSQLSSGYKMRFELVRNLLRRPKVLLLDEPLANLDIMAQQVILEDLKFLSQSISNPFGVILSSQQLYEVEKVSTEIIFLEHGKLRYQTDKEKKDENVTIIEIDVNNSKKELISILESLELIDVKFNGGSYIAYFPIKISMKNVLKIIGESDLEIKYIRDISSSSRRFFIN
ncbi:MAG: ABC transporter ATP-binding protein [Flavobacteriaceae bacterium]|nr:ABC transporter ATP-binding protein [Candidatus Onthonaster equi]